MLSSPCQALAFSHAACGGMAGPPSPVQAQQTLHVAPRVGVAVAAVEALRLEETSVDRVAEVAATVEVAWSGGPAVELLPTRHPTEGSLFHPLVPQVSSVPLLCGDRAAPLTRAPPPLPLPEVGAVGAQPRG